MIFGHDGNFPVLGVRFIATPGRFPELLSLEL